MINASNRKAFLRKAEKNQSVRNQQSKIDRGGNEPLSSNVPREIKSLKYTFGS